MLLAELVVNGARELTKGGGGNGHERLALPGGEAQLLQHLRAAPIQKVGLEMLVNTALLINSE